MKTHDDVPYIVFAPGNGDSASIWMTTAWRFESNGWPRDHLVALELPLPLARTEDNVPQEGRSSIEDYTRLVTTTVDGILARPLAPNVILVANSRGGYAVRSFVEMLAPERRERIRAVVLAGVPNHGVWSVPDFLPNSEFNGAGPFLTGLNHPHGPYSTEAVPGVPFLTLRSDGNDKYAQPTAAALGRPNMATNIDASGPALSGATNLVLPGVDHRETAFSAAAFEAMWAFLEPGSGRPLPITPEPSVQLDGKVLSWEGADVTNVPMSGAHVTVYHTDPTTGARLGKALLSRTTDASGRWGPLAGDPDATYEFVVEAPGFAITHIYRSPFARSSDWVNLRPVRLSPEEERAPSTIALSRPRGYFDARRDIITIDGQPATGVPAGVATVSLVHFDRAPAGTAVVCRFNAETITVQSWPAAEHHAVIAELSY